MISLFNNIIKILKQKLLSTLCYGCSQELSSNEDLFCSYCKLDINSLKSENRCLTCYDKLTSKFCKNCFNNQILWKRAIIIYDYSLIIKEAIKIYKYNGNFKMGQFLANNFADNVFDELINFKEYIPDAILYIPIHAKKLQSRGFNQCYLFAKMISLKLEIPIIENLLFKTKHTKQQAKLTKSERLKNLAMSFQINSEELKKIDDGINNILVIDDVMTTGNTLNCCVNLILKHKIAKNVIVACLARNVK